MTAADCTGHERAGVELSLITAEPEALAIFGRPVGAAVRRLLEEAGVASEPPPTSCSGTSTPSPSPELVIRRAQPDRGWSPAATRAKCR
jgi:hypothetical protein